MYEALVEKVQRRLAERPGAAAADIAQLVREEAGVISDVDVLGVLRKLRNDSTGAGILEQVLAIEGVTDVVVNGPDSIWFDRGQGLQKAGLRFDSDDEVRQLATRLAVACGRRLDDAQPFADGRLRRDDDSSIRVHALLSPPADGGTCLSLRVLRQAVTTLDGLVDRGTMRADIADTLRGIVESRKPSWWWAALAAGKPRCWVPCWLPSGTTNVSSASKTPLSCTRPTRMW